MKVIFTFLILLAPLVLFAAPASAAAMSSDALACEMPMMEVTIPCDAVMEVGSATCSQVSCPAAAPICAGLTAGLADNGTAWQQRWPSLGDRIPSPSVFPQVDSPPPRT